MDEIRCQSCGMHMVDGFWGTEKDGQSSQTFCKFCYQDGAFVLPDLTVEDMIQLSIHNMVDELHMAQAEAERLARAFIPKLERWGKAGISNG